MEEPEVEGSPSELEEGMGVSPDSSDGGRRGEEPDEKGYLDDRVSRRRAFEEVGETGEEVGGGGEDGAGTFDSRSSSVPKQEEGKAEGE